MSSMYRPLVAEGDGADAPARIEVRREEARAVVTLTDPERLNALSAPLVRQLRRALEGLVQDPALRTIVLTGTDPGFCAGGDLRMMEMAIGHLADGPGTTDTWRGIRNQFGAIARLIVCPDTTLLCARKA